MVTDQQAQNAKVTYRGHLSHPQPLLHSSLVLPSGGKMHPQHLSHQHLCVNKSPNPFMPSSFHLQNGNRNSADSGGRGAGAHLRFQGEGLYFSSTMPRML